MAQQVSFTQMADGTPEEWALLDRFEEEFNAGLPDRILGAVDKLNGSYGDTGSRGTRTRCRPRRARCATGRTRNISSRR